MKIKIVTFDRQFVVFDEQALRVFVLSLGYEKEAIDYRMQPGYGPPEPVEDYIRMIGDRHDHPHNADDPEAKRRGYYYSGDCASVTEVLDRLPTQPTVYFVDSEELDSEPAQGRDPLSKLLDEIIITETTAGIVKQDDDATKKRLANLMAFYEDPHARLVNGKIVRESSAEPTTPKTAFRTFAGYLLDGIAGVVLLSVMLGSVFFFGPPSMSFGIGWLLRLIFGPPGLD